MSIEATPAGAPSIDSLIDTIVREDDAREQAEQQATAPPEPEAPQAPDPEPETQEPEPEPKYTVKVRGQEVEVTLDELRNGYSRTEDYKAKTAELAEQRRALESRTAEFAARATKLDEVLSRAPLDPVLAEGQQTDWAALARDNPAEYVQRRAVFDQRVQQWREVAAAREMAVRQAAEAQLAESARRMADAVPEWNDEGKRKELQTGLAKTLEGYGFKPEEFQHVSDHRVLLVARDAMLYRQMMDQRKAAEAKKSAPTPPRTVTPGTPQAGKSDAKAKALLKQAAKSGRVDDQVNAILAALE